MPGQLAHVKWFVDPRQHPTQYELLLTWPVILAFVVALAALGIAYVIQHRVPEPNAIRSLERYARTGPLALRIALGLSLLAAAAAGWLFVPSLPLDDADRTGAGLLIAETVCGVLLLSGLFTRYAALLLALLGAVAMLPFSIESILEQVHILGIAVFLFITGPGPMSLDARGQAHPIAHERAPAAAINLLRIAMGFGIAYGALTEKLLNPPLAQALLDQSPFLNVLRPLGVSDPVFIWLAGVTELAVGVVILFAGGWWLVSAKNWFKGPKVQGTAEELAAIERDLTIAETS